MKLWIIYKEGLLISKVIAEMLQDRLESVIDVSVGKSSKIDPSLIVEEEFNYLIIGDIISEIIPSVEIQNWVIKYGEISEANNIRLESLSGFLISLNELNNMTLWLEFVQNNIMTKTIFPPVLCLKLDKADLTFETYVHEMIKDYSLKIIEFITHLQFYNSYESS